jgi:hypothetical protein
MSPLASRGEQHHAALTRRETLQGQHRHIREEREESFVAESTRFRDTAATAP